MSLKVEDEESCRAAGDLEQLTGETMAAATTVILRECL